MSILRPAFYLQDTVTVARQLLGMRLVRIWRGKRLSGVIVETEAYLGAKDRAAHTWNGRSTKRVQSMYLTGGHAYVYQIYGMHFCLNAVTGSEGVGEAVLIRALEPEEGLAEGVLTTGPGRLCSALHIDKRLDGHLLQGPTMFIERTRRRPKEEEIGTSARIGVDYAGEAAGWPLRFFWRGSPSLSRKERSP